MRQYLAILVTLVFVSACGEDVSDPISWGDDLPVPEDTSDAGHEDISDRDFWEGRPDLPKFNPGDLGFGTGGRNDQEEDCDLGHPVHDEHPGEARGICKNNPDHPLFQRD